MPLVTFQPSGKSIEAAPGTELLDVARAAGLVLDAPCGGKGTCGECLVRIISGNVDADGLGTVDKDDAAAGFVLACKSKVAFVPVVVELSGAEAKTGGQFIENAEESVLVKKELMPAEWNYEPLTVKWFLVVAPPATGDGRSDLDRLTASIQKQWGKKEVVYPLSVIRQAAEVLRAQAGQVTVTLMHDDRQLSVVSLEAGDTTTQHFGVAVDIGTTTVAVELVQLYTAGILEVATDYNDQIECGLDVISRITYAARPARLKELREKVLASVNRLIRRVAQDKLIRTKDISTAVVSGNTTMVHLLLGLNPEFIRLEPYVPTFHQAPDLLAAEIGIDINPQSRIYLSPAVGSYVGGDITAGVLCTDLALDRDEVNLFIDIGTNGEMVVGNREFLMTCACSAGPAFEGGGIECGMRASLGAIERVEVDPATGKPTCAVIGNGKPRGICGSGMITLLANLFLAGMLDRAGQFNRERKSEFIQVEGRRARYVIVPAAESGSGKPITVSELDVNNILRAKAAIFSACSLMLRQLDLKFGDLANIYIAGGFGRFLDIEKAIVIGMIPDLPKEKYHYIGNSSLMGSYMILVSQEYKQKQQALAGRMTYIDLSAMPDYMDHYSGALFLPHTDVGLFQSVKPGKENLPQMDTDTHR
jgi:uncharacterized 2Fe-2S/4Fe-4S cluster protein (DUF4445 family)